MDTKIWSLPTWQCIFTRLYLTLSTLGKKCPQIKNNIHLNKMTYEHVIHVTCSYCWLTRFVCLDLVEHKSMNFPPLNFCKDHIILHFFGVFSLNTFLIQDILIDCGKAVTSINLNPITPYHLGLGCEDSTVRVFDRRALSSGSSNKMNGMFCQFRPDSLSDRTCRVTSLNYR